MPGEEVGGARSSALEGARGRLADALRFHPRETLALSVLAVLVVLGGALAYVRARPAPAAALAPVTAPTQTQAAGKIVVHVVGAVQNPGVYTFAEGARVIDALRAAGGVGRGSDVSRLNLARVLGDGEQIVVPRSSEQTQATAAEGGGAPGGNVNINSAGVTEFDSLPGIGPVLAQRIVDYRDQHGPFRSIRDLMKVPGIGPRKFESLEAMVTL